MKKIKALAASLLAAGVLTVGVTACGPTDTDAQVGSENIATAAEQFELLRSITFINGITDKYLYTIEGFCSIEDKIHQLAVTCKTSQGLKKDILGLSDNVTYTVLQHDPVNVSTNHYRIIVKPETLIPDFDRP